MIYILSLATAYDIFSLPFSVEEIKGEYYVGDRLLSSGYNWVAGTFGGRLLAEFRGLYGDVKFFSSGNMDMTDESGNTIGKFSSNFINLKFGKYIEFGNYKFISAVAMSYIGLAPSENALALSVYTFAYRDIKFSSWLMRIYTLIDNIGYEIAAVGRNRDVLPYRISIGSTFNTRKFRGYLELSKFALGGLSGKLGAELKIYTLDVGVAINSRYRQLNGGYGLDFLSGLSLYGNINIRRFNFAYSYTFLGLFGSRNLIQIGYSL